MSGCDLPSQQERRRKKGKRLDSYIGTCGAFTTVQTREIGLVHHVLITTVSPLFLGKCCGSIVLYIAIFSFEGMQDVNRGLSCGDMGIVQLASRVPFSFGRGRDEGLAFLVFLSTICYLKPLEI